MSPQQVQAQSQSYEILPSPDLWYNDVDGILLGLRLKGQVPGSFDDGPHRLDASAWVGLWFPRVPVSYRLSYTEPIPAWSDFGSEANVQAFSSIRTGFHQHGLRFNKRWQQGFDERKFWEVSLRAEYRNRFDLEYTHFPQLWSLDDHFFTQALLSHQGETPLGSFAIGGSVQGQWVNSSFVQATLEATKEIPFARFWGLRLRTYGGVASGDTAPEYLFSRSTAPAADWLGSAVSRAKGTIPQPWIRSGNFQVAGGPNLRGYTKQDVQSFRDDENGPFLQNSIGAFNAEFDFASPFNVLLDNAGMVSDFLSVRSYLFFDAGTSLGLTSNEIDNVFANSGAGLALSLNIPGPDGRPRGFVFRYDVPFWLSDPADGDEFQYRSIFAFGAVVSF
ncbi:MAG: hypothetical protein ACNA78_05520 [Balneolaceae bacterium]